MIAYLLKKFPRLSETFVLNEVLGQEALGRNVHVFSRRPPDDEPRHPQLARLRAAVEVLPQGVDLDPWRLLFDPPHGRPMNLAGMSGLVREVVSLGHPRASKLLTEAVWLLGRCEELGVRHVHVHFASESAVTAMFLAELGGPTYSVTAHAKDIYRANVDVGLLERIVARSRFTVTVCDANVRHLAGLIPSRTMRRVRRLYNGIDVEFFAGTAAQRRPGEILSVGRLVPKKGFDVLLLALAELRARGVEFHACLVGQGEEEGALRALAASLGLSERVEFAGPLDQVAVRDRMARASVLCLPCRLDDDGNRDALPTVLLEALAAGLPIVSTRVTGIPEILDGGRVGMLVEPGAVGPVADALAALLADPALRASYSHLGRAWAAQQFDGRAAARALHGWHDEVLEVAERS